MCNFNATIHVVLIGIIGLLFTDSLVIYYAGGHNKIISYCFFVLFFLSSLIGHSKFTMYYSVIFFPLVQTIYSFPTQASVQINMFM